MRNFVLYILGISLFYGCGEIPQKQEFVQESFLGGEHIYTADANTMRNAIASKGISVSNREIFGYKAYAIPYATTDLKGKERNISGLLVVPTNLNQKLKDEGLSMISYGHGTIFRSYDRPSDKAQYEPIDAAVAFSAGGGFATLITDYAGYQEYVFPSISCDKVVDSICVGNQYLDGDIDFHPYLLKDTLAQNSIDFITAVKKVAKENGIKLNNKLFVSGYSEGGFTAMSTLQKLEENNISVIATAPMAGPYDIERMAEIGLDVNQTQYVGYTPALTLLTLNAYTKKYDFNISEIIDIPKYVVEEFFTGFYTEEEINEKIYRATNNLFLPTFLADYKSNSNHQLKIAFKENRVNNWQPKSPVKLIHCQGDDVVPFDISQNTFSNLSSNGATDISLSIPDADLSTKLTHSGCYYPALERAVDWFIEQRDK